MMRRSRLGIGVTIWLVVSAGAVTFTGACGSSSSSGLGGSAFGGAKGAAADAAVGAGGGSGSSGSNSGAGGRGLFQGGASGLIDSSAPTIQPDAACGDTKVGATTRVVNVLLVIDKSGSMSDKPTGFSVDKWTALKTALGDALGAVKADISFGLDFFPASDPGKPTPAACEMPSTAAIAVPVAAGTTSVPQIISALATTAPGGNTPTAAALARAMAYYTTGAGASLPGDKYVLLATDGGPNCSSTLTTCDATACTVNIDGKCPSIAGNCCAGGKLGASCLDDVATKDQIAALAAKGIKTFVVGIPGSEAYKASLESFALAGGEVNPAAPPSYFAVSAVGGTQGLSTVLVSITKQLVTSCSLQLKSAPPDNRFVNVLVDGTRVPEGADGFKLDTTTTPPTVQLLGSTCAKVEATGAQSVQVLFGCKKFTR